MRKPAILIVTGRKNSGKTTLIAGLIPALRARGVTLGVVKHDAHGRFAWDQAGKDTARFWDQGAEAVALIGPDQYALRVRTRDEHSLTEFIRRHYREMDLVLVEGFGRIPLPKLEVVRKAISNRPLFPDEALALVTDCRVNFPRPTFPLAAYRELADFIIRHFRLTPAAPGEKKPGARRHPASSKLLRN